MSYRESQVAKEETTMTATQQLLYQEIQTLPDDLVAEVLDFVQFLKSGSTEEAFLWSQVEKTYLYRRQHP